MELESRSEWMLRFLDAFYGRETEVVSQTPAAAQTTLASDEMTHPGADDSHPGRTADDGSPQTPDGVADRPVASSAERAPRGTA